MFGELVARWQRQPDKPFETDIHIFQHAMHVRAVPLIQEQTELLMLYVRSLREVAAEAMSTKLTSLGQLTANLAHEIRNPMSAIRHASDLLQEGNEADALKAKLYNIIDSNIQRIDKMLEDVSLFNKRDNISRQPINLMKFWLEFKQEFTFEQSRCHRLSAHEYGRQQSDRIGRSYALAASDVELVQQCVATQPSGRKRHYRPYPP